MPLRTRLSALVALTLIVLNGSIVPISAPAVAQSGAVNDSLVQQLAVATGEQLTVERHPETGTVRFLAAASGGALTQVAERGAATQPEQVARGFLHEYGTLFGVNDQARELSLLRTVPGGANATFVRFQQRYAGVPVLGGELVVQVRPGGAVASVAGEALPELSLDTTPVLSAEQAQQRALAVVAQHYNASATEFSVSAPELWIFNPALLGGPGLHINTLTWRVEVTNLDRVEPVRELVLVDAQRGSVALHFNQVAAAKDRLVCDAQSQPDADRNPNNDCDEPGETARGEGQAATGVADVDLAFDYAGDTYDYLLSNFGRDSLDGAGMPLISLVRYCPDAGNCPYNNAFWNGRQMTYGTGYAAADDVVAHELSHGFTNFSSNLFYYYQSGAINESMSDIFGEFVDLSNGKGNDAAAVRWQLGEDLVAAGGAIRNMNDPTLFGHPDRTSSAFYSGSNVDSGGVHSNSGVSNKAAALLVDGGSFNGQTIASIGLEKTGQIFYLVNNALLTSASDYLDLGSYMVAACQSLVGVRGITAANCTQVENTVLATEMHQQPLSADVPAEAAICPSGQSPQDLFFDDMENPNSGNWATSAVSGEINEWFYGSQVPAPLGPLIYAASGDDSLWGNDYGLISEPNEPPPTADFAIATTNAIALPPGALLHFQHATDFEIDPFDTNYDGGVVEYSVNGTDWLDLGGLFEANGYNGIVPAASSNPLAGREVFGGISGGYFSSRANLSTLAGQSIRLRLRIGTDEYNPASQTAYGWFVDDLRVYTCVAALPPPAVAFASTTLSVNENALVVSVAVALSAPASSTIQVGYTLSNGTATAGTDYVANTGILTFNTGQSSKTLEVKLLNDAVVEAAETLVVTLRNPSGATLGSTTTITITIVDEDAAAEQIYLPLVVR